jgi:hypothetical protein
VSVAFLWARTINRRDSSCGNALVGWPNALTQRGYVLMTAHCMDITVVPPYTRVIRSKTYGGYVNPRIIQNALYNVILSDI